jgi:hypothetical protein
MEDSCTLVIKKSIFYDSCISEFVFSFRAVRILYKGAFNLTYPYVFIRVCLHSQMKQISRRQNTFHCSHVTVKKLVSKYILWIRRSRYMMSVNAVLDDPFGKKQGMDCTRKT